MQLTNDHVEELDRLLSNEKKLLIVLHNHPDPDALASGFALKILAESRYGLKARIAYAGLIGRAENQAMVRELRIPLSRLERIRIETYSRIAVLDTQPGAGNNELPRKTPCHLVIDHHPPRRSVKARVSWIFPEYGTTATIFIQLFQLVDIPMNAALATALSYAIRSETQDLGREATADDIQAFLSVFPRASMGKLSRIAYPSLPRAYFESISQALNGSRIYRQLLVSSLGTVPMPEIVAEMADLLLRHERITWTLCTGYFQDALYLSMRTSNLHAHAGQLLKRLVPYPYQAGGHDQFAGGRIPCGSPAEIQDSMVERIFQRFAQLMGYPQAEWRPLLRSGEN